MQTPFDIAADLHTPVSADFRLKPRYLLNRVLGDWLRVLQMPGEAS